MLSNKLDFSGFIVFVGIDVHKKNWVVSFRSRGKALRTFSMPPNPRLLFEHLVENFPGAEYRSVYEAGFSGFWAHRELNSLGILNKIVHPADVPLTHKEKDRKSDVVDSKKLAISLEKNTLSGIYIPSMEEESFRNLVRMRYALVKKRTRLVNQLKSFLNLLEPGNTPAPSIKNRTYKNWLENDACEFPGNKDILHLRFSELQTVHSEITQLMKKIRESIKINNLEKIIKILMSVPGVGFVSAIILYSELINMDRFKNLDKLLAYVGLIPSVSASGETSKCRGMTKRNNKHLRSILIESSWVAIRTDPALFFSYTKYSKRMPASKAIVSIAKKLLSRLRHVWKTGETYTFSMSGGPEKNKKTLKSSKNKSPRKTIFAGKTKETF